MGDEDHEFDLLIPFVCVTSVGGPFDDDSFVAGIEFERIAHTLNTLKSIDITWYETNIRPALLKQVDLVAMHYGWTCTELPVPDDVDLCDEHADWVYVKFEMAQEVV